MPGLDQKYRDINGLVWVVVSYYRDKNNIPGFILSSRGIKEWVRESETDFARKLKDGFYTGRFKKCYLQCKNSGALRTNRKK
jgi:hypothetical protein